MKLEKEFPKEIIMEQENRIKQNIQILGPIILFSNPAGSPINKRNLFHQRSSSCMPISKLNTGLMQIKLN